MSTSPPGSTEEVAVLGGGSVGKGRRLPWSGCELNHRGTEAQRGMGTRLTWRTGGRGAQDA